MTYLRFDAASLPAQVGTEGPHGSRMSDGRSGYISYGPYFKGDPGTYVAGFYIRRAGHPTGGPLAIDVCGAGGREFARRSIPLSDLLDDTLALVHVNFALHEPSESIEVRLFVESTATIELQSLVIFKTPARYWGGI